MRGRHIGEKICSGKALNLLIGLQNEVYSKKVKGNKLSSFHKPGEV